MEKEVSPQSDFHALTGVFFIILIVLMFFLALKTGTSLFPIIVGLLPSILYVSINFELLYKLKHKRFLVFVLPIVLVLLYAAAASLTGLKVVAQMDLPTVIFLNLLICYVFAGVILFSIFVQREIRDEGKVVIRELRHEATLKESIHSLEDKSKAINYAIGRVYSDKHGGTKELRERIMVSKDWYNKFSELSGEYTPKEKELLKVSLDLMSRRLALYGHKEKDVFGKAHESLKNIARDPKGNDTVAAVLIRNDKDPVESYIKGAKEACQTILESEPLVDVSGDEPQAI